MSLADTLKDAGKKLQPDAEDASYRLAGRQLTKMTREPIVAFLSKQLGDGESTRAKVAAFLDTDLGEALVSTFLAMGLTTLPDTMGEITKRLAKEMRVSAMTGIGDVVVDLLAAPMRAALSEMISGATKEVRALPQESVTITRVPVDFADSQEQAVTSTPGSSTETR
jgi:hypothetical protein